MEYQERVNAFYESQLRAWPLLGYNHAKLEDVRLRTIQFGDFTMRVQFNPARITSSAAKVDPVSVKHRKCFLCAENRPPQQKSLKFGNAYEILCNPFPIFREHLTIARTVHTPQVIGTEVTWLLELSRALPGLVVFYNGPDCGASAPDHMHFQAGSRGILPIEEELPVLVKRYGKPVAESPGFTAVAMDDGLRRMILLESDVKERIKDAFIPIDDFTKQLREGGESMLNILAYYSDRWQIFVFPRDRHRPRQFFEKGEKNILLSPAAVDLGGLLITPLEKDFNQISGDDIRDIFAQVSMREDRFGALLDHLVSAWSHKK